LETIVPQLLAMLSILAVFIPALFMTGAAHNMFMPLALAVGFAMVASYILSATLVPVLAIWILPQADAAKTAHSERFEAYRARYERTVRRITAARRKSLYVYFIGAAALLLLAGVIVGSE